MGPGNSSLVGRSISGQVVSRDVKCQSEYLSDSGSQVLALFLSMVAILVHAIVAADGEYGTTFYGWLSAQIGFVLFFSWYIRRRAVRLRQPLVVAPLLVIAGLVPPIWDWFSRRTLGIGEPFEIVSMTVVRNLVLGLAVVGFSPSHQRLSVVLSLFLALFGLTASRLASTQWLVGLFAIGGVCWLVISHWEKVRRRLRGRDQVRWPRWVLLAPLLLVMGMVLASSDGNLTRALGGIFPSSGGTEDSDPFARDGVGDGEKLVAGTERIQSFAPIEDAPFMQDDQPSLYDLFDDTYEGEVKIAKTDRAVALPPEMASRIQEHLHHKTEKANREFSTVRQPEDASRNRHAKDIRSNALIYVAGRVPLHLRLQVYDLFDGETWYPEPPPSRLQPLEMITSGEKPWLKLKDRGESREFLGPAETHALKIIRMETNVIPAPLYLHGVHIDLVDRVDLFKHGPDGLVAMNRESLPALVPIHIASRAVNGRILRKEPKMFLRVSNKRTAPVIPEGIDQNRLRQLAEEWSTEAEEGWDQVSAISLYLQNHYILDSSWRPKTSTETPIEQFLYGSRRGPDYQFATAAALLLRSLGYQARVVSGFYADPEKYDSDSRHTPIYSSDVHFWAEVRLVGGDWVTVEASPGYEVLGPPPGLLQRLWQAVFLIGRTCVRYGGELALLSGSLLLLWYRRRGLADQLNTLHWLWITWWIPARLVAATLRLLRQRAKLANCPPGVSSTHHQWLGNLIVGSSDTELARRLYELRQEIDVAAYSRSPNGPSEAISENCRHVIRYCTIDWFRSRILKTVPTPQQRFDVRVPFADSRITPVMSLGR